ncbi:uncharacterized protein LOC130675507 [Microplitis mediator]|uniref:uncharacterized protein LOC130675507 n=1 Tax=Microplitis mediator TaxID=375433 RepID=UPI002553A043|nr:uncharacterized protein LOC130675507 [Microplitis mediator]
MAVKQSAQEIARPVYENGVWKGPKINLPEGYFRIGERVYSQFKKYPAFVGQIDSATGKKDTYNCMGMRSIKCAVWLKKQGISRGDVVGLCSKNHSDVCMPLFASFYLGAIFNPWWHTYLDQELVAYFINTTKPKVLFVDEDNAEIIIKAMNKIDYSFPVVIFGEKTGLLSFKDILQAVNDDEVIKFECTKIEADEPALIMCTSGTTSFPKEALHSYQSFANMISHYTTKSASKIFLGLYGICWISALSTVFRSILCRATMIVSHNLKDEEICWLAEKYKVTHIWIGTPAVNRLSKIKCKYDVSLVERVTYSGAATHKEVIESFHSLFKNADIYVRYGGTEFGPVIVGKVTSDKVTSCGKVFFNTEVKVVDPDSGKILGPNENGELYCRTPMLITRYWNNLTVTEETIDSEGWYHTGDLGYYDIDGNFFIVDRIKELIRNYLHYIPPVIIESVVQDLPGVAEVAVVAKPSFEYNELPIAFITKVFGMQVTEAEIDEALEKKLFDRLKLKVDICFLEKMPYTSSKKIDRKKLRVIANALALAEESKSCYS